jgi:hypothetical protein
MEIVGPFRLDEPAPASAFAGIEMRGAAAAAHADVAGG